MGVFEFIGKLILAILSLAAVAFFWSLIMEGLAKATNTKITHRGTTIATPEQFDQGTQAIKRATNAALSRLKNSINSFKTQSTNITNTAEKLRLLKELEDLRTNQTITETEYNNLKNEILN